MVFTYNFESMLGASVPLDLQGTCCFNLETSQEHKRWNPNPVSGCKQAMK